MNADWEKTNVRAAVREMFSVGVLVHVNWGQGGGNEDGESSEDEEPLDEGEGMSDTCWVYKYKLQTFLRRLTLTLLSCNEKFATIKHLTVIFAFRQHLTLFQF